MRDRSGVPSTLKFENITKLSHLTWALCQLLRVCAHVKSAERCVGDLTAKRIRVERLGVLRAQDSVFRRPLQHVQRIKHERMGHDISCHTFGISRVVLLRLIQSTSVRGRELLEDVVEVALAETQARKQRMMIAQERWELIHGPLAPVEVFEYHCEQLVAPLSPWENGAAPEPIGRGRR